jgi:hypothetical protein
MVNRHLSIPHEFVCITDNSSGFNRHIKVIDLKTVDSIKGWWYKPFVFSEELDLQETVLFLDLDIIIFDSIDKLFEYEPNKFCAIKGFSKHNNEGINSSCFRFNRSDYYHLYEEYIENHEDIISSNKGDQDWLGNQIEPAYWPKEWIQSFKLDLMKYPQYISKKNPNTFKYFLMANPQPHKNASIAVFHGKPNPHEIEHVWCKTHWK